MIVYAGVILYMNFKIKVVETDTGVLPILMFRQDILVRNLSTFFLLLSSFCFEYTESG